MEYLKNVILKFITLTPGTERVGLIPVLDTMLQFDQSERNRLVEIAGQEEDAANSSWGSYLPRWGGIWLAENTRIWLVEIILSSDWSNTSSLHSYHDESWKKLLRRHFRPTHFSRHLPPPASTVAFIYFMSNLFSVLSCRCNKSIPTNSQLFKFWSFLSLLELSFVSLRALQEKTSCKILIFLIPYSSWGQNKQLQL